MYLAQSLAPLLQRTSPLRRLLQTRGARGRGLGLARPLLDLLPKRVKLGAAGAAAAPSVAVAARLLGLPEHD